MDKILGRLKIHIPATIPASRGKVRQCNDDDLPCQRRHGPEARRRSARVREGMVPKPDDDLPASQKPFAEVFPETADEAVR
ncbi:hypothetical protein OIU85_029939 [Salix viminalis]|uniref:Uncharacterized protein n=1 Tax=Salix viminalis TaxID=40686 RepID=A0A9Q0QCF7_SALVM|nr:hypothetical protein OIU85_029939 [Salix viminalis]